MVFCVTITGIYQNMKISPEIPINTPDKNKKPDFNTVFDSIMPRFYERNLKTGDMDIARENYEAFVSTSTTQNMQGSPQSIKDNLPRLRCETANIVSRSCLAAGTGLLCLFALINLVIAKTPKFGESGKEAAIKLNLPPPIFSSITNTNEGTTMSKDANKPVQIQGVKPSAADGSIKGVRIGDPTTAVKSSYSPRQQDTPPPPPPPPPAKK